MSFNSLNLSYSWLQQGSVFYLMRCVVTHKISQNHPHVKQVVHLTSCSGEQVIYIKGSEYVKVGVLTDHYDIAGLYPKAVQNKIVKLPEIRICFEASYSNLVDSMMTLKLLYRYKQQDRIRGSIPSNSIAILAVDLQIFEIYLVLVFYYS